MVDQEQLEAIAAAARNAATGPWEQSPLASDAVIVTDAECPTVNGHSEADYYGGKVVGESMNPSTIQFLIAAQPRVVLALVDEIRELRTKLMLRSGSSP